MEQEKKNKKGMYVLIGLGVIALTGTALYFLNQHRKKRGSYLSDGDELIPLDDYQSSLPALPDKSASGSGGGSADFPLKKGSKGSLVKNIQQALIAKFGKSILPKYGADGHWGSEMDSALKKLGLPTSITAGLFQQILTNGTIQISGISDHAEQLKTIVRTTVWNRSGKKMNVPAHTIIGKFVDAKNNITQFRTLDNQYLFINTNSISYV